MIPPYWKAMIAALQAEKCQDLGDIAGPRQLVQALRLRSQSCRSWPSASHRKSIEREIEQLELALERLATGRAEGDEAPIDEGQDEPAPDDPLRPRCVDVHVSRMRHRASVVT